MARVKLLLMSKVCPKRDVEEEDSVARSMVRDSRSRGFDVLRDAENCWVNMDTFRHKRERNKRYVFGRQWDDWIEIDGCRMREEDYIRQQGKVPLKNNLVRKLVRTLVGLYEQQSTEPVCTARDREEQSLSETMSTTLQYNMKINRMNVINSNTFRDYVIGGLVAHKKTWGWRNQRLDCWTDRVDTNHFFVDNNMRDERGWDCRLVGEIHDISWGALLGRYASSPEDVKRLETIYGQARYKETYLNYFRQFGEGEQTLDLDFLVPRDSTRCRVIEVWRKETKGRYRCHDYNSGEVFVCDPEDYEELVLRENAERRAQAESFGIAEDEVPLIAAEWFVDEYWYYYFLTPFGDILSEGETPYAHKSHPYVFKAYPFIDGEIHSFIEDVIDQQRYVNRLITLYDWILGTSAKGALLFPEEALPEGMSMEQIADSWARFNGIILYKPKAGVEAPRQIAANCTGIGITEMLSLQMKLIEDISGVNSALQGKQEYAGMSAAMFNQQTQNATTSLVDLLDTYSDFTVEAAYKDVKNIQQFYDEKRVFNIVGRTGKSVTYDPDRLNDIDFDIDISESQATPVYRQRANELLMELWRAQAISVQQLLEHGDFPFADQLLQSLNVQQEQMEQGGVPDGVSPELQQQVQQGADMEAVDKAYGMLRPQDEA